MTRPALQWCRGYSQKTGKRVGQRHRWLEGWGKGRCEYCGKYLEDVLEKPKPDDSLESAIARSLSRG